MITYYQQHKNNNDNVKTFCECTKAQATHFSEDDGKKQPLNKLTANHIINNVPKENQEPVIMPSIFENTENHTTKNDADTDTLEMPVLNFDDQEKAKIDEKNKADNKDNNKDKVAVYNDEKGVPATPAIY
jgi:hypothetical protein